jgi:hypothetical protein
MINSSLDSKRRWFGRVMWVGILANFALAVPTLLFPERMLEFTNLPLTVPIMWVRFAALLLILLSVFYMPAAVDPDRYRATAWMAVGSRLAGVLFFLTQPREYLMFGLFDLAFFVPEAILLWRLVQSDTGSQKGTAQSWGTA